MLGLLGWRMKAPRIRTVLHTLKIPMANPSRYQIIASNGGRGRETQADSCIESNRIEWHLMHGNRRHCATQGYSKQKTKVVKKTLNPVWDQPGLKLYVSMMLPLARTHAIVRSFVRSFADASNARSILPITSAGIRIEVWDKDLMSKDFMGETIIPTDLIVKGSLCWCWYPRTVVQED